MCEHDILLYTDQYDISAFGRTDVRILSCYWGSSLALQMIMSNAERENTSQGSVYLDRIVFGHIQRPTAGHSELHNIFEVRAEFRDYSILGIG